MNSVTHTIYPPNLNHRCTEVGIVFNSHFKLFLNFRGKIFPNCSLESVKRDGAKKKSLAKELMTKVYIYNVRDLNRQLPGSTERLRECRAGAVECVTLKSRGQNDIKKE